MTRPVPAYARARIYRISAAGAATLLYTTGQSGAAADASTSSATPITWTYNVPSGTILDAGERYGVRFEANVTTMAMPGPYTLRAFAYETLSVATNKCSIGAYRGVGQPIGGRFARSRASWERSRFGRVKSACAGRAWPS